MRKNFPILAGLLAILSACIPASRAGSLVLADGATLQGTVTLSAEDNSINLQVAGKPPQNYKFASVKSAIFDSLATGSDPDTQDYVPWARAQVTEVKRARVAEIKGNVITIRDGAGGLAKHEVAVQAVAGIDRCFVFQKLEWDGEIVAHFLPAQSAPGSSAGLMICEGLEEDGPVALVSLGPDSRAGVLLSTRPARGESETLINRSRLAGTSANWLKLRRTWDTFSAFESADGLLWIPVGECRVEMDDKKGVFIGVTASAPSAAMLVTFDHVRLSGRRTAALVPGATDPRLPDVLVRLADGTVLSGLLQNVSTLKGEARIRKSGGEILTIPVASIARAHFGPMTREDLDKFNPATHGALTHDGDFLEGEIKDVRPNDITVSSVTFGLTTMERRRVTGLVFQPTPPQEPGLTEVRLQDGSLILSRTLTVENGQLLLTEPLLGILKIPFKDIISLDRKP